MGLQQGKVYTSTDSLRYGSLMIMADQVSFPVSRSSCDYNELLTARSGVGPRRIAHQRSHHQLPRLLVPVAAQAAQLSRRIHHPDRQGHQGQEGAHVLYDSRIRSVESRDARRPRVEDQVLQGVGDERHQRREEVLFRHGPAQVAVQGAHDRGPRVDRHGVQQEEGRRSERVVARLCCESPFEPSDESDIRSVLALSANRFRIGP